MTLARQIRQHLLEEDGTRDGQPAGGNGDTGSGGERETLPLASRALAGSANFGALLANSDKRTLAILELRRLVAAAKRRGYLVARSPGARRHAWT